MDNTENPTSNAKAPAYIAYQIREGSEKSYWTRIGGMWAHKDGNGFSVQLDCVPLDGKITLRIASENK